MHRTEADKGKRLEKIPPREQSLYRHIVDPALAEYHQKCDPDHEERFLRIVEIGLPIELTHTNTVDLIDRIETASREAAEEKEQVQESFLRERVSEAASAQSETNDSIVKAHLELLRTQFSNPYQCGPEWGQNSDGATVPWRDNEIDATLENVIIHPGDERGIEPGNYAVFRWTDKGIGMDRQTIDKVFFRMYASENEARENADGEFGVGGSVSPWLLNPDYFVVKGKMDRKPAAGTTVMDLAANSGLNFIPASQQEGATMELFFRDSEKFDISKMRSTVIDYLKYLKTPIYLSGEQLTVPFRPRTDNSIEFQENGIEGFVEYTPGKGTGIEVLSHRIKLYTIEDPNFSGAINYDKLPKIISRNACKDEGIESLIQNLVDVKKSELLTRDISKCLGSSAKHVSFTDTMQELDGYFQQFSDNPHLIPRDHIRRAISNESDGWGYHPICKGFALSAAAFLTLMPSACIIDPYSTKLAVSAVGVSLLPLAYYSAKETAKHIINSYLLNKGKSLSRRASELSSSCREYASGAVSNLSKPRTWRTAAISTLCAASFFSLLGGFLQYVRTNSDISMPTSYYEPGNSTVGRIIDALIPDFMRGNSNPYANATYSGDLMADEDNPAKIIVHSQNRDWSSMSAEEIKESCTKVPKLTLADCVEKELLDLEANLMKEGKATKDIVDEAMGWIYSNFKYAKKQVGDDLNDFVGTKRVKCDSGNVILAYLLRRADIPTRLGAGSDHMWCEYYSEGDWQIADATPYMTVHGDESEPFANTLFYLGCGLFATAAGASLVGTVRSLSTKKNLSDNPLYTGQGGVSIGDIVEAVEKDSRLKSYFEGKLVYSQLNQTEKDVVTVELLETVDGKRYSLFDLKNNPDVFLVSHRPTHMDDVHTKKGRYVFDGAGNNDLSRLVGLLDTYGVSIKRAIDVDYEPVQTEQPLTDHQNQIVDRINRVVSQTSLKGRFEGCYIGEFPNENHELSGREYQVTSRRKGLGKAHTIYLNPKHMPTNDGVHYSADILYKIITDLGLARPRLIKEIDGQMV